jgi:hypothetical protein
LSKQNALFVPAISEYQLDELVNIFSDIRDFMGVTPECYFEQIAGPNGLTITGRIKKMELREGQQVDATVTLKTAAGNPAAYQKGTAKWTTSDETAVQVMQAAAPVDELKATIYGVSGANNTPVLITFTCDGDPDSDQQRDIVATLDVVCTQGEAVVAEIDTGTATDSGPQVNPLKAAVIAKKK